MKKYTPKPTPQYIKRYYMTTDLLKHGFCVTTIWRLKKMLKVSAFSFKARLCTSEQRLTDWPGNSKCRKKCLGSIPHSLFQVLDVIDFCTINSSLQMSPETSKPRKSRPCCWSISSYSLCRKHVLQKFRNCKKEIWRSTDMH